MKEVTVIGSGSWGTAIAVLLNSNGHKVKLWSFLESEAQSINKYRENKEFLPNVPIAEEIFVCCDCDKVMENSEYVVCAVPSAHVRSTMERFAPYFNEKHTIINISKGFDEKKKVRLSQVIEEFAPKSKICVLSGPSHAEEVSRGIPSAVVAASSDISVAEDVQHVFMNDVFRVYTNNDVIGVELGGALKNVIALVAGMTDGLGYGDNTKAALMTRGMAEISRLAVKMGGSPYTLHGLTGIGDLIVTCTSMHSRNRRAGILIGQGKDLEETLNEVHMVVEGVNTAKTAHHLAKEYDVEMPICAEAYKVLFEQKDLRQAVYDLMTRDKTSENSNLFIF